MNILWAYEKRFINKKIVCADNSNKDDLYKILILYFFKNRAKNKKNGNTNINQEIIDYILNISSYELQRMYK